MHNLGVNYSSRDTYIKTSAAIPELPVIDVLI